MTTSILVAVGVMFIPVAMLNFGKGEAKTTGGIVFVGGIITLVGAFFTAVVYKDNLGAALFFSCAILYLVIAQALLMGVEDWRSVGQCSFVVALLYGINAILFFVGTETIAQNYFVAFMDAAFCWLTIQVGFMGYGKCSGKAVGITVLWVTAFCLFLPAFYLLAFGRLPF